jgi:hypothetical protein
LADCRKPFTDVWKGLGSATVTAELIWRFHSAIKVDPFLLDPQGELPYSPRPKKGVLIISSRAKEVMVDSRHGNEPKSEEILKKEVL